MWWQQQSVDSADIPTHVTVAQLNSDLQEIAASLTHSESELSQYLPGAVPIKTFVLERFPGEAPPIQADDSPEEFSTRLRTMVKKLRKLLKIKQGRLEAIRDTKLPKIRKFVERIEDEIAENNEAAGDTNWERATKLGTLLGAVNDELEGQEHALLVMHAHQSTLWGQETAFVELNQKLSEELNPAVQDKVPMPVPVGASLCAHSASFWLCLLLSGCASFWLCAG